MQHYTRTSSKHTKSKPVLIRTGINYGMYRRQNFRTKHLIKTEKTFICCLGKFQGLVGFHGKLWKLTHVEDWYNLRHPKNSTWLATMPDLYLYFYWGIDGMNCDFCRSQTLERHPRGNALVTNVHHLLLRLQRWTKRILSYRKFRLSVFMAFHSRLGEASPLNQLNPDLLGTLILSVAFCAR